MALCKNLQPNTPFTSRTRASSQIRKITFSPLRFSTVFSISPMAEPISLHILSDDDQDPSSLHSTPLPIQSKKRRTEDCDPISTLPYPTILIIDDDPTPRKPGSDSTPSFVAETPLSGLSKSDVSIVKCTYASSNPEVRVSTSDQKFAGKFGYFLFWADDFTLFGSSEKEGLPHFVIYSVMKII